MAHGRFGGFFAVIVACYVVLVFGSWPLARQWERFQNWSAQNHVEALLTGLAGANQLALQEGRDLSITAGGVEKAPGVVAVKILDRTRRLLFESKAETANTGAETFRREVIDSNGGKVGEVWLGFSKSLFLNGSHPRISFVSYHLLLLLMLIGVAVVIFWREKKMQHQIETLEGLSDTFPWLVSATSLVGSTGLVLEGQGRVVAEEGLQTGKHILDFVHQPGEAQKLMNILAEIVPGGSFQCGHWKGFCWQGKDTKRYLGVFHAA